MDDLLSEKEQIDQIKNWWSEYGTYVIGGIVLGAVVVFGYKYHQNNKLQAQLEASDHYEALVKHVVDGDLDDAVAVSETLMADYSDTSYTGLAGLAMAKLYMDKNRDQEAGETLQAIVDGDVDDELKHVARLRLARVLLYQEKPEEVVALLEGLDDSSFAAAYSEVRGDAYATMGRFEEAQLNYQEVLLNTDAASSVDPQLVQWKSLDLPAMDLEDEAVEAIEPEDAPAVESEEPAGEESE